MIDAGVLSTAISAAGAIGVAYIGVHQRKDRKNNDKCEALRSEGALLQLEMTQAELKLSKVTAKAVLNQKTNGDVEEAMNWVKEVEIKFADYMRRTSQTL